MTISKKIILFWFDWPNRVWKWTQMEIFSNIFQNNWIPTISVRWDWSRPAMWNNIWDPKSSWRDVHNKILKSDQSTPMLREEAANRLARELIIYKNRIFPNLLELYRCNIWIILIDRSLISRTIVPTQYNLKDVLYGNYLYKWRWIDINNIKPDLLFCLHADKNTLLHRLDKNDPKYNFRYKAITENSDKYINNIKYLPEDIQEKVIVVDWSEPINKITQKISKYMYDYLLKTEDIDLSFLLV